MWEAGFWSPSIYACDYIKSRGRREVSLQMELRSLISWPLTREVILDFLGGQESQRDAWGEEAREIRGFTEIWLTAAGPEDGEWPWAKECECGLEGEVGPQPTASKDTGTPRNPHTGNGLLPATWMSLEVDSSLEPPERNPTLQTPWFSPGETPTRLPTHRTVK